MKLIKYCWFFKTPELCGSDDASENSVTGSKPVPISGAIGGSGEELSLDFNDSI